MITAPLETDVDSASRMSRLTIISAVFFAATILLLAETLATLDVPTHAVVWGGIALAAYSGGLLCLVSAKLGNGSSLARWRFGQWILIWCGITYGLATVTWRLPQTGIASQVALTSILKALWFVAIGMTAWMLGYFVGPGSPVRRSAERGIGALRRRFADEVRSFGAPWILYGVGSAARIASTAASGQFAYLGNASLTLTTAVTGYGQILRVLGLCAPLGVAAAATQIFQERLPRAWLTLAVLFPVELVVSLASGLKENVLIAILAVTIPYCAARKRLPKGALIAVIVLFLGVVIPFTTAYRTIVRGGPSSLSPSQAFDAAPGVLSQVATLNNAVSVLPTSFDYLSQRVSEIETPAIIIQRTPSQIPFLSPADFITSAVYGFIPRALWSGKPVTSPAYAVSQEYFGITAYNAVASTPIGGLYQYGGLLPIIFGMFIFGCLIRLIDDLLDIWKSPHAIFFAVLLFPRMVSAEGDLSAILASFPEYLFVWVIAVAITFRVQRVK